MDVARSAHMKTCLRLCIFALSIAFALNISAASLLLPFGLWYCMRSRIRFR